MDKEQIAEACTELLFKKNNDQGYHYDINGILYNASYTLIFLGLTTSNVLKNPATYMDGEGKTLKIILTHNTYHELILQKRFLSHARDTLIRYVRWSVCRSVHPSIGNA